MDTTYWLDKTISFVGLVRASRLVDAERRLTVEMSLSRRLAVYCKKYIGDLPFIVDSETDNSEAIQYRFDIAAALNTPVALPLGRFTIKTAITRSEGCTLVGDRDDAMYRFGLAAMMDNKRKND